MARYTGPKCRLCRREGMKLSIKGAKCVGPACPMNKRPYAPGQRPNRPSKPTSYALQLREKQKVKRSYGVLEKQFRGYYSDAVRMKGVTGRIMLQLLERRLDNVIYRLLFASSRCEARQLVRHGFVRVNGRKVDIPSYRVKVNDTIEVADKNNYKAIITENATVSAKDRSVVSWLFQDQDKLRGDILRLPEKEDIVLPINEQLIVELYSK